MKKYNILCRHEDCTEDADYIMTWREGEKPIDFAYSCKRHILDTLEDKHYCVPLRVLEAEGHQRKSRSREVLIEEIIPPSTIQISFKQMT